MGAVTTPNFWSWWFRVFRYRSQTNKKQTNKQLNIWVQWPLQTSGVRDRGCWWQLLFCLWMVFCWLRTLFKAKANTWPPPVLCYKVVCSLFGFWGRLQKWWGGWSLWNKSIKNKKIVVVGGHFILFFSDLCFLGTAKMQFARTKNILLENRHVFCKTVEEPFVFDTFISMMFISFRVFFLVFSTSPHGAKFARITQSAHIRKKVLQT